MVFSKSQTNGRLDVFENLENNGINYQPQLVIAGFLPSTVRLISTLKR